MKKLSIAISPCPNDIFIFGALILSKVEAEGFEFDFSYADIQTLNQMGDSNQAPDVLKFSYAHYPNIKDKYALSRSGSALGRGVGPLMIGRTEPSLETCSSVLIPGFNTTAHALLKRYTQRGLNILEESYERIMPRLKNENILGVIIHESRFTYSDLGLELKMDLGQKWHEETKLPLPLGGIGLSHKLSRSEHQVIEEAIESSLKYAYAHPKELDSLLKKHAQELSSKVIQQHIDLYVNDYSLDFGKEGLKAIETLLA